MDANRIHIVAVIVRPKQLMGCGNGHINPELQGDSIVPTMATHILLLYDISR